MIHLSRSSLVVTALFTLVGSTFGQMGMSGEWKPPTYPAVSLPVSPPQFTTIDEQAVRAIQVRLNQPVDVNFKDTPLIDVVAEFQRLSGVRMRLDPVALDEYGLSNETTIRFEAKRLPAAVALSTVLEPLDFRYVIGEHGIEVTSSDEARRHIQARVYEVTDLIRQPVAREPGHVEFDFDTLIDLISGSVRPDSWDMVGGESSISGYPANNRGTLVIYQTLEAHDEIEALLNALRRSHRLPSPALNEPSDVASGLKSSGSQPVTYRAKTNPMGRSYQLSRSAIVVPASR